jgi:hypothetical protein
MKIESYWRVGSAHVLDDVATNDKLVVAARCCQPNTSHGGRMTLSASKWQVDKPWIYSEGP